MKSNVVLCRLTYICSTLRNNVMYSLFQFNKDMLESFFQRSKKNPECINTKSHYPTYVQSIVETQSRLLNTSCFEGGTFVKSMEHKMQQIQAWAAPWMQIRIIWDGWGVSCCICARGIYRQCGGAMTECFRRSLEISEHHVLNEECGGVGHCFIREIRWSDGRVLYKILWQYECVVRAWQCWEGVTGKTFWRDKPIL